MLNVFHSKQLFDKNKQMFL